MSYIRLARQTLDACRARGQTLATAESCTGGMICAALTQIAGSSDVVMGGVVSYSNGVKAGVLQVKDETLAQFGAVSQEVAEEMVAGALLQTGADIAISVTGIAGPGGSEHKPEGRVCFGLGIKGGETSSRTVEFGPLGRAKVRDAATRFALESLRDMQLDAG